MIPTSNSYSVFFKQVSGKLPYPCQIAYSQVDSTFVVLRLPTGFGKTLAVLVSWLFRQQQGKAPTRLVIIEPMRVLVGQVVKIARKIVEKSGMDIPVHLLMGGAIDNTWITEPEKRCVIIGTQDQILSRQLNRGYACTRWSWPQHFALLNNDCEFFIDECQLMGPGYLTTVELSHWREQLGVFGNCRVVWSSATLDVAPLQSRHIQATEIKLEEEDYRHDALSGKVSRPKILQKLKVSLDGYGERLAEHILKKHISGTMTLVIVNQVSRAIAIFKALQDSGIPTRLLHGRYRPEEREGLVDNLETFQGIIVSTQVVEAGVDLDARTLFTEIASWASLVQRIGRCGRNDTYPEADIYWIDSQGWPRHALLPYSLSDCQWSQKTLEKLDNVSIQILLGIESPPQNLMGQTLTKDHLVDLFDNHPSLDDRDIDISQWIRNRERTVHVAWVDSPPASDWFPSERELCSVPLDALEKLTRKAYVWDDFSEVWTLKAPMSGRPAVLLREWGGYSGLLGFTGNPGDKPPKLSQNAQENQKSGWDRPSYLPATQAQHGAGQAEEMARIRKTLSHIDLPNCLDEIAAWSDIGKSHPVWQKSATGNERPSILMAKSSSLKQHSRKGFRHELASSLALLQLEKPFHYAYLVAAHHGKCRTQFCPWVWEADGLLKGVKSGDLLPATNLGIIQSKDLSLIIPSRMEWERGVRKLLKTLGPFRLAYQEALIRAADVADSKKYEREPERVKSE